MLFRSHCGTGCKLAGKGKVGTGGIGGDGGFGLLLFGFGHDMLHMKVMRYCRTNATRYLRRCALNLLGWSNKSIYGRVLVAIVNALQAITAKLDADSGVGDTDYAATLATYVKD